MWRLIGDCTELVKRLNRHISVTGDIQNYVSIVQRLFKIFTET